MRRTFNSEEERKEAKRIRDKKYWETHKEKKKKYDRNYCQLHKEKRKLKAEEWRKNNKNKKKEYSKEYSQTHKKEIYKYHNNRYKIDTNYKLACNLRSRCYHAIKDISKLGSTIKDLGCSIPELKVYLESKFQKGMTWENWSKTGWHIDHIQPLSSFNLSDRKEFLKAVHYTNLQPLWAEENLKKGKTTFKSF